MEQRFSTAQQHRGLTVPADRRSLRGLLVFFFVFFAHSLAIVLLISLTKARSSSEDQPDHAQVLANLIGSDKQLENNPYAQLSLVQLTKLPQGFTGNQAKPPASKITLPDLGTLAQANREQIRQQLAQSQRAPDQAAPEQRAPETQAEPAASSIGAAALAASQEEASPAASENPENPVSPETAQTTVAPASPSPEQDREPSLEASTEPSTEPLPADSEFIEAEPAVPAEPSSLAQAKPEEQVPNSAEIVASSQSPESSQSPQSPENPEASEPSLEPAPKEPAAPAAAVVEVSDEDTLTQLNLAAQRIEARQQNDPIEAQTATPDPQTSSIPEEALVPADNEANQALEAIEAVEAAALEPTDRAESASPEPAPIEVEAVAEVPTNSNAEADNPWLWYDRLLDSSLKSRWRQPASNEDAAEATALLAVSIDKQGRSNLRLAKRSGNSQLDSSLMDLISQVRSLPELPQDYPSARYEKLFVFRLP